GKAALLGDLEPLWQPPALEIGNRVWGDLNEDGIQGPGEAGLGGVTVTLWADTTGNGTADTQVGTAVTDAAGNYYFVGGSTADGNPGDAAGVVFYNGGGIQASTAYEIRTDLTQGGIGGLPLTVANAAQPANGNAADSSNDPVTDVADSDAVTSGATGVIAFTTGAAGVNNFGLDLGIAGGTAAIGDYVWNDLDQDGIQDAGEPGIADVTVNLYDGTGAFIMSDVTDVTGIYGFSVAPGTYTVEIEAAEFFAGGELYGFVPSPTGPGESVGVAPFYQYTLTVADGEVRLDVDYGFYADGKLLVGDYVWRDPNRNGTHVGDSGETEYTAGFDGVLINVYRDRDGSGTVTPGDTLWTVTTTGDDPDTLGTQTGWYNVGVLSGEPFLIEIAASNFNPGGVLEGAVSTTGGEVQYVNVTSQNLDFDFGYAYSMSLGSYILHDLDSDGIQDAGEPGIDGATVTLLFESGGFGPAIDLDGNLVLDVVTGADGLYYFDNLPEGTYKIRVTPPAGYLPSPTQNTTPDDDTENDSNLVSESSPGTWDSIALVLAGNAEPIESGAYAGDNQDNTVDANGNMTLDAGFVLMPSLAIEKMLNTPDPVRVGDAISFTIRITNTGPTTIVVLPLEDTYETDYLAYVDAIPTPDNNDNDGTINWSNLTAAVPNGFGSDLGPGAHVDVVVNFIGRRDTSLLPGQEIVNTAMVDSAEDEFGAMPDPVNDDEPVSIFSPTGVLFADRGASREGALVSLRWSTLDETQIAAFHVVRTNSDGTEVVLTADAIPAQFAGQATGTSYSFTDADLAGQSTVHYDLEVVAPDGTVTRLDMGRVHVGA
ncbi:MAG: hypothetical protein KDE20_20810, partial [Caldilineaceae bacterium]|nr:hypothetical protein [Caldilineaceae bacterium]